MFRRSGEAFGHGADALRLAFMRVFGVHLPAAAASLYGPRGLKLVLNVATACLVVALPLAASAQTRTTVSPTGEEPVALAASASISLAEDSATRASTTARGLVAGSRSVVTQAAQDVRPIETYAVADGDVLGKVAEKFQVNIDDIAFANSLDDDGLHVGQQLMIPPGRGALYVVKAGDTIDGVAQKFKVDPGVIMTYNRLYFEPEHFAPEQLIFVPGADVPAVKRTVFGPAISVNNGQVPPRTGRLGWPVNGVITQYFWWGHTGVDIAAPYGTTIGASDDGVVVATGWVAVGGLRVCVQHAGGLQTCYYHTGAVFVNPGQTVARGQPIASIGLTGVTTGPHVHWELKVNGVAANPLGY